MGQSYCVGKRVQARTARRLLSSIFRLRYPGLMLMYGEPVVYTVYDETQDDEAPSRATSLNRVCIRTAPQKHRAKVDSRL